MDVHKLLSPAESPLSGRSRPFGSKHETGYEANESGGQSQNRGQFLCWTSPSASSAVSATDLRKCFRNRFGTGLCHAPPLIDGATISARDADRLHNTAICWRNDRQGRTNEQYDVVGEQEQELWPRCSCHGCRVVRDGAKEQAFSEFAYRFHQYGSQNKPGQLMCDKISASLLQLPPEESIRTSSSIPKQDMSKEQQAQQRALLHKEKESARRDVQKSMSLCLKHVTPNYVSPCSAYRHSKNNVEEPANLVTYDRALLHIVNLEAVCDEVVKLGIISQEDLDRIYASTISHSVGVVRSQLECAEHYISTLRTHKVQNPGLEQQRQTSANK